jgi:lysozyme
LLSIFSNFTLNVTNGFLTIPITQMRIGSAFTDMLNAIHYPDQSEVYQLGQPYGTKNTLTGPSYQQAPVYQPGGTTPPREFPTSQPNGYTVPLGMNPASMYQTSSEALRVIKMFEGLNQRAYMLGDQAYIGYGHKIDKFDATLYWSRDKCEQQLQSDVQAAEGKVKGAISGMLSQGQFDALVSFAFTSPNGFASSSVVQKASSGDIPGAVTALAQYCYVQVGGVVTRSLHLTSLRAHNIHWMSAPVKPLPPN